MRNHLNSVIIEGLVTEASRTWPVGDDGAHTVVCIRSHQGGAYSALAIKAYGVLGANVYEYLKDKEGKQTVRVVGKMSQYFANGSSLVSIIAEHIAYVPKGIDSEEDEK